MTDLEIDEAYSLAEEVEDMPDIEEAENEDDLIFLDVSWAKTQEKIYKPIIQQLLKEGWFPNQEGENNYGCFVVLKRNINKF